MCNKIIELKEDEEEKLSLLDIVESMNNDDIPRGESSYFPFSSNGDD